MEGAVLTKSGPFWVEWATTNAPNSSNVDDLAEPFRSQARAFIKALTDAGARVTVTATKRSARRAYLFHWSWKIFVGACRPHEAQSREGVDILWDHGDERASKAGSGAMVGGFGLAVPPSSTKPPALTSNHIEGTAIDMDIKWAGSIRVRKKDGQTLVVPFKPDVDTNTALHMVGASYGVLKLVGDRPHWSHNGR
jgi:hypothetical protein